MPSIQLKDLKIEAWSLYLSGLSELNEFLIGLSKRACFLMLSFVQRKDQKVKISFQKFIYSAKTCHSLYNDIFNADRK